MGGWRCPRCNGENVDGMAFCGWCGVAHQVAGSGHDEQRLVTALFADISGFTTLADTLDTEELHFVIAPVISVLAGIAESYGGTLAKYAGDAVLVFFGAPVSQEDHAVRAALTALDMHTALAQAVTRLGPDAQGLELHIGINTGHVIAGMFGGDVRNDYSILGDSVNVAQRLESVAPPGATYVGEITRQLIESDFELESLGALELKGKTKPVDAWKLVGRRSTDAVASTSRTALVGREVELQSARAALDDGEEHGLLFSVVAEAGGGKTRLTQDIRSYAEDRGVTWLDSRCISYGASLAYFPFIDLLRRTYGIAIEQDPVVSAEHLRNRLTAAELTPVIPYFARVLGLPAPTGTEDLISLEPEAFRRELHNAFAAWLRKLLRNGTVVLAIEDAHWIDTSSLDLAADLGRLARDHRLIVYVTGRPEASDAIGHIASVVDPMHHIEVVLGPLDRDATRLLLASTLRGEPSDRLLDVVLERTSGNPFFAEELTRSLQETGGVRVDDGVCDLVQEWDAASLPPTIEGVLAGRIDMLSRPETQVLQVASVIGKRVNPLLLDAVADDITDLPRQLDRLIAGGFIDRTIVDGVPLLTFHHAIVADVAYARLVRRQRRDLHRRVAEAAEAIYGTGDDVIDLLARHFYLAEAGVKAVDYLERAGKRSEELFANQEAMLHFDRAVQLARLNERVASRLPDLTLHLADLEELTGNYDEAERLFAEVKSHTNDVRAWRGLAAILRHRGRYDDSLEVLEEGASLFEHDRLASAQLALERGWTLYQAGRQHESIDVLVSGLRLVDDTEDPIVGHLLLILARSEEHEGQFDLALEHARAALQQFEDKRDLGSLARALRQVGGVLYRLDRYDEAANELQRGLAIAERVGNAEELGACLINLGLAEEGRGAMQEGVACDLRAIEQFERTGNTPGRAIAYVNLADKLVKLDRLDEALLHCETGLVAAREIGYRTTEAEALDTMATILLRSGRAADAVAAAEEASAIFDEMDAVLLSSRALQTMAEALEVIGERERARTVLVRARSLSASVG